LPRDYSFHLYIMASKSRRLYTGMTKGLWARVKDHKEGKMEGFTKKHQINRLVYFESFKYVKNCIDREKQVKDWTRAKRVALIQSLNPTWEDLAEDWYKDENEKQVARSARDDKSKK